MVNVISRGEWNKPVQPAGEHWEAEMRPLQRRLVACRGGGCGRDRLGLTAPAWAGLDEGTAAYKRGDHATALREGRPLAEQGVAKAQFNLRLMCRNGLELAIFGSGIGGGIRRERLEFSFRFNTLSGPRMGARVVEGTGFEILR
jgi:hypothetical protein